MLNELLTHPISTLASQTSLDYFLNYMTLGGALIILALCALSVAVKTSWRFHLYSLTAFFVISAFFPWFWFKLLILAFALVLSVLFELCRHKERSAGERYARRVNWHDARPRRDRFV